MRSRLPVYDRPELPIADAAREAVAAHARANARAIAINEAAAAARAAATAAAAREPFADQPVPARAPVGAAPSAAPVPGVVAAPAAVVAEAVDECDTDSVRFRANRQDATSVSQGAGFKEREPSHRVFERRNDWSNIQRAELQVRERLRVTGRQVRANEVEFVRAVYDSGKVRPRTLALMPGTSQERADDIKAQVASFKRRFVTRPREQLQTNLPAMTANPALIIQFFQTLVNGLIGTLSHRDDVSNGRGAIFGEILRLHLYFFWASVNTYWNCTMYFPNLLDKTQAVVSMAAYKGLIDTLRREELVLSKYGTTASSIKSNALGQGLVSWILGLRVDQMNIPGMFVRQRKVKPSGLRATPASLVAKASSSGDDADFKRWEDSLAPPVRAGGSRSTTAATNNKHQRTPRPADDDVKSTSGGKTEKKKKKKKATKPRKGGADAVAAAAAVNDEGEGEDDDDDDGVPYDPNVVLDGDYYLDVFTTCGIKVATLASMTMWLPREKQKRGLYWEGGRRHPSYVQQKGTDAAVIETVAYVVGKFYFSLKENQIQKRGARVPACEDKCLAGALLLFYVPETSEFYFSALELVAFAGQVATKANVNTKFYKLTPAYKARLCNAVSFFNTTNSEDFEPGSNDAPELNALYTLHPVILAVTEDGMKEFLSTPSVGTNELRATLKKQLDHFYVKTKTKVDRARRNGDAFPNAKFPPRDAKKK